jgi:hypothetical protein
MLSTGLEVVTVRSRLSDKPLIRNQGGRPDLQFSAGNGPPTRANGTRRRMGEHLLEALRGCLNGRGMDSVERGGQATGGALVLYAKGMTVRDIHEH